jgi:glycosyltransferase involved in cell wall biosynthesis
MDRQEKISLCITNYNRHEMLLESFAKVIDDNRISEIVIVDDHSDEDIYNKVKESVKNMDKVRLLRNKENVGMSRNKYLSVYHAKNQFCIIFDSDNTIDSKYIDQLYQYPWHPYMILCPDFAKPNFDYRKFGRYSFDLYNVKQYLDDKEFSCLINTCNYFVNRQSYMNTYLYDPNIKASDTIYFNYRWLKAGHKLFVVPGMEYDHRVHKGSGFLEDAKYNMRMAEEIKQLIKLL